MSVYVDNMRAPFGRMKMCHMVADTHGELIAMAIRIGISPHHIQRRGEPLEHFDVSLTKRKLALEAGAIVITRRQLSEILSRKRAALATGVSSR